MRDEEIERLAMPGQEVIVDCRSSPMHGRIGETAGLSDSIGGGRIRVLFDGQVYVFLAEALRPI